MAGRVPIPCKGTTTKATRTHSKDADTRMMDAVARA